MAVLQGDQLEAGEPELQSVFDTQTLSHLVEEVKTEHMEYHRHPHDCRSTLPGGGLQRSEVSWGRFGRVMVF
jgi:hypothetical protein